MVKTIDITVFSNGGVSPDSIIDAGVQGDDKTTALNVTVDSEFIPEKSANETLKVYAECVNGAGEYYVSDFLDFTDNTINFPLPIEITRGGGMASLHFVFSVLNASNVQQCAIICRQIKLKFEDSAQFYQSEYLDTMAEALANVYKYREQIEQTQTDINDLQSQFNRLDSNTLDAVERLITKDTDLQSQIDTKATRKVAVVGSDTGNSAGWYKVASGTMEKDQVVSLLFAVHTPTTSGKHSGILQLDLRGGDEAILTGDELKLGWLVRAGFDLSQVLVKVDGYNWILYYNVRQYQYSRVFFEVIQEGGFTDNKATYKLYGYGEGTLRTTAPLATAISVDLGTVNTANKLTTARNINGIAFDGSKDINITANDIESTSGNSLEYEVGMTQSNLDRIEGEIIGDWDSSQTISDTIVKLSATDTNLQTQIDTAKTDISSLKAKDTNLQSQIDTKVTRKVAVVGSDEENSAGWYKVASGTMAKYQVISLLFAVHTPATSGKHSGILQLDLRGGTESIDTGDALKLGWLVRAGFDSSQVIVTVDGYNWALYYNVQSNRFFRAFFEVIQESSGTSNKATYNLHTDSVVEATAPVATATSTDLGTVNTANKLTTARNINGIAFDGSKDINITANDIESTSGNGKTLYDMIVDLTARIEALENSAS